MLDILFGGNGYKNEVLIFNFVWEFEQWTMDLSRKAVGVCMTERIPICVNLLWQMDIQA